VSTHFFSHQVKTNESQMEFARRMLSEVKRNPRFPPFLTAVSDAVESLLEDAIDIAQTMGVLSSAPDSSVRRLRDQGMSPAAQPAAIYYRPVLTQLMGAALKFHLQVQGTAETAYIFVPGEPRYALLELPVLMPHCTGWSNTCQYDWQCISCWVPCARVASRSRQLQADSLQMVYRMPTTWAGSTAMKPVGVNQNSRHHMDQLIGVHSTFKYYAMRILP
jgi:hypothetical protein